MITPNRSVKTPNRVVKTPHTIDEMEEALEKVFVGLRTKKSKKKKK